MSLVKFLTSKTFVKQLVLALIVLIALVFLSFFWLKKTTNHNQHITVPDISKQTYEQASKALKKEGLRLYVMDSTNYNPNFPKHSVIEQIPASGSEVKRNRKIYVTLNPSGYRSVEVPNMVGRTHRQARPTLEAVGFTVGKITYRPHIARGEVLQMLHNGNPINKGDKLQITSVIDLVLGDGSARMFIEDEEDANIETSSQDTIEDEIRF